MRVGNRSWGFMPTQNSSAPDAAKGQKNGQSGVSQPLMPITFGRAFVISSGRSLTPPVQDVFIRSLAVQREPSKPGQAEASPFKLNPQAQPTPAKPNAKMHQKAKLMDKTKDKPKEEEGGDWGDSMQIAMKKIPGQIIDLSKQIRQVMSKFAQMGLQKSQAEKMRQVAQEFDNQTLLKQAKQEVHGIERQEKPVQAYLKKLLDDHGKRLPDKYVPVQVKVPKAKKKGR